MSGGSRGGSDFLPVGWQGLMPDGRFSIGRLSPRLGAPASGIESRRFEGHAGHTYPPADLIAGSRPAERLRTRTPG